LCKGGKESRATEGERGDRSSVRRMTAFSRASSRKQISQKWLLRTVIPQWHFWFYVLVEQGYGREKCLFYVILHWSNSVTTQRNAEWLTQHPIYYWVQLLNKRTWYLHASFLTEHVCQ
jgi:hypothetical protein